MIAVTEWVSEAMLEALRGLGAVHYDPEAWRRVPAASGSEIVALVVRNRTRVDRQLLEALPNLKVVGRLGSGLDNLDLQAVQAQGIAVVDGRGLNRQAVAEAVLAMLLWWARPWERWRSETRRGVWRRELDQHQLAAWRVGVVGMGHIGQEVSRLLTALGVEVWAYDAHPAAVAPPSGVHRVLRLEELLEAADVVTLHLALVPETVHLLNHERLSRMKPEAYLINTARGGLIDERALVTHLAAGRFRGVWLDVREAEPPPQPDPVAAFSRVWLTPHVAGRTREAEAAIDRRVLAGIRAYLGRPDANRR
ncbi:MAG: phosphoglycerate dehydrogenase [Firmicutes bacterium]|nr:phosphoglycerate dehydrogenase [Alicyclobacillaceae bacterium]MCL6497305.1 phosphoglycerate dehydrogenase [Bacillota bacterium]